MNSINGGSASKLLSSLWASNAPALLVLGAVLALTICLFFAANHAQNVAAVLWRSRYSKDHERTRVTREAAMAELQESLSEGAAAALVSRVVIMAPIVAIIVGLASLSLSLLTRSPASSVVGTGAAAFQDLLPIFLMTIAGGGVCSLAAHLLDESLNQLARGRVRRELHAYDGWCQDLPGHLLDEFAKSAQSHFERVHKSAAEHAEASRIASAAILEAARQMQEKVKDAADSFSAMPQTVRNAMEAGWKDAHNAGVESVAEVARAMGGLAQAIRDREAELRREIEAARVAPPEFLSRPDRSHEPDRSRRDDGPAPRVHEPSPGRPVSYVEPSPQTWSEGFAARAAPRREARVEPGRRSGGFVTRPFSWLYDLLTGGGR